MISQHLGARALSIVFVLSAKSDAAWPASPATSLEAVTSNAPEAAPRGEVRFGAFEKEISAVFDPVAVAIDAQGRILVASGMGASVSTYGKDGVAGTLKFQTDGAPRGIALGPDGTVFVSDAVTCTIMVFDAQGKPLEKLGRRGVALGEFAEPSGLCLAGTNLYIADTKNHRIQVLDLSTKTFRAFGRHGPGDGELAAPLDVAVDSKGDVFVADLWNQRVVRFDAQGKYVTAWGGFGPFAGLFHGPTGVEVWKDEVYVTDQSNHRVQVFDASGKQVHEWGLHALEPRQGQGRVHYPKELAIAPDGSFAALIEPLEDRVQIFKADEGGASAATPPGERTTVSHYGGGGDIVGDLIALLEPSGPSVSLYDLRSDTPIEITRFGENGTKQGQFLEPVDVELDANGQGLWVSDPGNARLSHFTWTRDPKAELKFEPFLAHFAQSVDVTKIATTPPGLWPFEPGTLELGPDGHMYVADTANRRIVAFDKDWKPVRVFGHEPLAGEQFVRPAGIAFHPGGGSMFVADPLGNAIHNFSLEGAHMRSFRPMLPVSKLTSAWMQVADRPSGIAVAKDGALWVSSASRDGLLRSSRVGAFAWEFTGGRGLERAQFHKPEGIVTDGKGRMVVVDTGNHRFQVLGQKGEFLTTWGAQLFIRPTLKR